MAKKVAFFMGLLLPLYHPLQLVPPRAPLCPAAAQLLSSSFSIVCTTHFTLQMQIHIQNSIHKRDKSICASNRRIVANKRNFEENSSKI